MRKSTIFHFALIFLTLVQVVRGANQDTLPSIPQPSGTYLLNENFNDNSSGGTAKEWTTETSGGTVTITEIPFPADKSLQLVKKDSAKIVSATRNFAPITGKATIEFKVRSEETTGEKDLPSLFGSDHVCAVTVAFNDGKIVSSDGDKQAEAQPFEAGIWYIIRINLDTQTSTYDLYVDGLKKVSAASFKNHVPDIASVTCAIGAGNTGTAYFDSVKLYTPASLIGSPPTPVFDVLNYGAVGDAKTKNTEAIQKAIDACAGTGGSVYLHDGIFMTGSIVLKSNMTLFIDSSATLFGSSDDADYPISNFSMNDTTHCGKAFIHIYQATNVRIDGGGVIDGNGGIPQWHMNGSEPTRPFLIHPMQCTNLSIQNVYLKDAAMWCLVPQESNYIAIRNIDIDSRYYGNRDGIDLVDSQHVLIENCTLNTNDDSICPKSGIRSGLDDITVKNCTIAQSVRASGIKFGTSSYGQFKNALFEDILIKNCDKAAIGLESVDGADISNITCRRIEINHTNSPFYIVIGRRCNGPKNEPPKIGSVDTILFEDIIGKNLKHNLGCPISGLVFDGKEYRLKNLTFNRCQISFLGGLATIPPLPPEMGTQYPECNVWNELPAYGYFIRHADNVTFKDCASGVSPTDARPPRTIVDVNNLTDSP